MNTQRPQGVLERLSHFLHTPLEETLRQHGEEDPRIPLLQRYRNAIETVPAYRQFLADCGVDARQVGDAAQLSALPLTNKANYMQAYPLPDRCKGGSLRGCDRLAVSSGSTGVPTFWPRGMEDELDVALRFEQVFRLSFRAHEKTTLAVVCFPMGNWVGGVFTASCCWLLAQKGYPLTVATPGNKPDEILRVVRELSPLFQQTVLLGYPPFVKDVLDTGMAQGIDWKSYSLKLVFAGEVFSEEWRSLVLQRVGSASPCHDSASLYGTADGGVLGNETPFSIAIRRFLAAHPAAARELFGESRLPTLVQYDPHSRFFEMVQGSTLAVSGDGGVPLLRYHIADRGGIMPFTDMLAYLRDCQGGVLPELGVDEHEWLRLPFVWVFGRADFTVSYYGANVYPENVTVGLEQPGLTGRVTGKFVMQTAEDGQGGQQLQLAVELLPQQTGDDALAMRVAQSVRAQLLRLNSEFANYVPESRQLPTVQLRPFAAPEYFPAGVKHRYTRKQ